MRCRKCLLFEAPFPQPFSQKVKGDKDAKKIETHYNEMLAAFF